MQMLVSRGSKMHKCFKLTTATSEDAKNGIKEGKIQFQEKEFSSIWNLGGKDNRGLSMSSSSSHNDLAGMPEQSVDRALQTSEVTLDGNRLSIPKLGIHHENENLLAALKQFYDTKVQLKRSNFHQLMSQIEYKVNDILDYVESVNTDLRFKRMSPACYYEIKAQNEIDVFLILEKFSPADVTIEELSDPQGHARIRISKSCSSEFKNFLVISKCGSQYLSARSIGGKFKGLVQRCFEDLPLTWRQASPSCMLNSQAYQVSKTIIRRSTRYKTTPKRVSFGKITASCSSRESFSTIINLIPVVECSSFWPVCSSWMKANHSAWPEPATMRTIIDQGVQLIVMPTVKGSQDVWGIGFLSARRVLLGGDEDNNMKRRCLQIVKILCGNEVGFSRFFLPCHLEHIFLHHSQRQPNKEDWLESKVTQRFLELLVLLHECLKTRNCPSFFIPGVNLFSGMSAIVSKQLSGKVMDIISDPIKYLAK